VQTLILKNEISIFDESPINVILLSTNDGTTLNAIWKQRKNTWYVVESGNEKNLIDILTPHQFDEAIRNGKYALQ
jgi:hypothetical protein